jgi:short-subunit dehydrogenase
MTAVDYRNQTTLITGASAGIGVVFAREIAARGSHLVLVARRRERLETLAAGLRAEHGIGVETIPMDLGAPRAGSALAAEVAARGVTVTSLVNNAGFATFGPFHEEDADRLSEEIAVDVASVVDITRAFIDDLRSAGNGVLINVASMAAYQANPNMAVYGAAKAFVLSFTEALWQESLTTGLRVLALSPGATETEFFDIVGTRAAAGGTRLASPEEVVDTALKALDRRTPPPSIAVGRRNRVFLLAARLLSRKRLAVVIGNLTKSSETSEQNLASNAQGEKAGR